MVTWSKLIAGQKLLKLINSSILNEKLVAIDIVGDLNITNFYSPIMNFSIILTLN